MKTKEKTDGKLRYAVVGIGHIAQVAVLPAFRHAKNSELVALVSGDHEKLDVLGDKYGVKHRVTYDDYDQLLASGDVDAVYIALPNHMHCDFTERAARARVHVLCEKPMAVNEAECRRMIEACATNEVKLMIAYRLHFEEASLKAIEMVRGGKIGDARYFHSSFSFTVREGDIRVAPVDRGGGPMHDIGVYCINAVRNLFGAEPLSVFATAMSGNDPKFDKAPETVSVVMRFPEYRLATFTVSYGADAVASYRIVGTKGSIRLDPAYEYTDAPVLEHSVEGKIDKKKFSKRDQFAPELIYFSDCVLEGRDLEPDGFEGLADVCIVDAVYKSIKTGQVVPLGNYVSQPAVQPQLGMSP